MSQHSSVTNSNSILDRLLHTSLTHSQAAAFYIPKPPTVQIEQPRDSVTTDYLQPTPSNQFTLLDAFTNKANSRSGFSRFTPSANSSSGNEKQVGNILPTEDQGQESKNHHHNLNRILPSQRTSFATQPLGQHSHSFQHAVNPNVDRRSSTLTKYSFSKGVFIVIPPPLTCRDCNPPLHMEISPDSVSLIPPLPESKLPDAGIVKREEIQLCRVYYKDKVYTGGLKRGLREGIGALKDTPSNSLQLTKWSAGVPQPGSVLVSIHPHRVSIGIVDPEWKESFQTAGSYAGGATTAGLGGASIEREGDVDKLIIPASKGQARRGYWNKDGFEYWGEVNNTNKAQGFGELKSPQQNYNFFGYWSEGVKHGPGTEQIKSGEIYFGEYAKDSKQGIGYTITSMGGKFLGEFVNGGRNGLGRLIQDGIEFVGYWKDNLKNGLGITKNHLHCTASFSYWNMGQCCAQKFECAAIGESLIEVDAQIFGLKESFSNNDPNSDLNITSAKNFDKQAREALMIMEQKIEGMTNQIQRSKSSLQGPDPNVEYRSLREAEKSIAKEFRQLEENYEKLFNAFLDCLDDRSLPLVDGIPDEFADIRDMLRKTILDKDPLALPPLPVYKHEHDKLFKVDKNGYSVNSRKSDDSNYLEKPKLEVPPGLRQIEPKPIKGAHRHSESTLDTLILNKENKYDSNMRYKPSSLANNSSSDRRKITERSSEDNYSENTKRDYAKLSPIQESGNRDFNKKSAAVHLKETPGISDLFVLPKPEEPQVRGHYTNSSYDQKPLAEVGIDKITPKKDTNYMSGESDHSNDHRLSPAKLEQPTEAPRTIFDNPYSPSRANHPPLQEIGTEYKLTPDTPFDNMDDDEEDYLHSSIKNNDKLATPNSFHNEDEIPLSKRSSQKSNLDRYDDASFMSLYGGIPTNELAKKPEISTSRNAVEPLPLSISERQDRMPSDTKMAVQTDPRDDQRSAITPRASGSRYTLEPLTDSMHHLSPDPNAMAAHDNMNPSQVSHDIQITPNRISFGNHDSHTSPMISQSKQPNPRDTSPMDKLTPRNQPAPFTMRLSPTLSSADTFVPRLTCIASDSSDLLLSDGNKILRCQTVDGRSFIDVEREGIEHSALFVNSKGEIVVQGPHGESLFFLNDPNNQKLAMMSSGRSPTRFDPHSSHKAYQTVKVYSDHEDFCLWVNHDENLSLANLVDAASRSFPEFFILPDEGKIQPVTLHLSLETALITGLGYSISSANFRKYFFLLCPLTMQMLTPSARPTTVRPLCFLLSSLSSAFLTAETLTCTGFSSPYFFIGGSAFDKNGLIGGALYGIRVGTNDVLGKGGMISLKQEILSLSGVKNSGTVIAGSVGEVYLIEAKWAEGAMSQLEPNSQRSQPETIYSNRAIDGATNAFSGSRADQGEVSLSILQTIKLDNFRAEISAIENSHSNLIRLVDLNKGKVYSTNWHRGEDNQHFAGNFMETSPRTDNRGTSNSKNMITKVAVVEPNPFPNLTDSQRYGSKNRLENASSDGNLSHSEPVFSFQDRDKKINPPPNYSKFADLDLLKSPTEPSNQNSPAKSEVKHSNQSSSHNSGPEIPRISLFPLGTGRSPKKTELDLMQDASSIQNSAQKPSSQLTVPTSPQSSSAKKKATYEVIKPEGQNPSTPRALELIKSCQVQSPLTSLVLCPASNTVVYNGGSLSMDELSSRAKAPPCRIDNEGITIFLDSKSEKTIPHRMTAAWTSTSQPSIHYPTHHTGHLLISLGPDALLVDYPTLSSTLLHSFWSVSPDSIKTHRVCTVHSLGKVVAGGAVNEKNEAIVVLWRKDAGGGQGGNGGVSTGQAGQQPEAKEKESAGEIKRYNVKSICKLPLIQLSPCTL
jgi:hypothetical protein